MIGGNRIPFRLACESVEGVIKSFLSCPFSHRHADEVAAFGNTTTMVDHCGNTIPAKPLLYQTLVCGDTVCDMPACDDCPGGEDLISPPNTPTPPSISDNTWAEIGTVQLEPMRKLGSKRVQAFKNWYGQFGLLHNDDSTDCATGLVKSNIRYRTRAMAGSAYIDDTEDPPGQGGITTVQNQTISIARLTGQRTQSDCAWTTDNPFAPSPSDIFSADFTSNPKCSFDVPSVVTALAACDPGSVTTGPSGSSGSISNPDTGFVSYTVSSTRTDTSYSWAIDKYVIAGPGISNPHIQHITGSITLSDPYTINDVLADAAAQANYWQLDDDLQHPFTDSNHTTIGPIVLRNEAANGGLNIFPACDWTDADSATNDGAIIGAPLAAGYGQPVGGNPRGVFDRDHENWMRKNCDPGSGWSNAPESRGAFTPSYVPANAPKWTDDFHATTLYPTAFINADLDGIYLQKRAEVPVKRPSINFARPFGPDKFALDETAGYVFYVSDFTAGVVTLQTLAFMTPVSLPFSGGDIVGSAALGGFYEVSSVGSDTVTLGALVYALPTDWNTPSGDGAACFGKLKYPNAPGINFTDAAKEVGGRVAVTAAAGIPVTLTTSTVQKYLSITTPENIDILDADLTVLASNVPATRVDDNQFTVTELFSTVGTARWIVPHLLNDGATTGQKYKFADTRSKGDYVYRTWIVSLADASVLSTTQTDACLPFAACAPSVAGITPNGETASNAHYWDFPTSVNNGELWLGQVQFWMVDPFWQVPHTPVAVPEGLGDFEPGVDLIIWREDNGSCPIDSVTVGGGGENIFTLYYAMRPYVEARCTLPSNIDGETPPALASGADLATVAIPPAQAFIVNAEGLLVDAIGLPTPPWSIMLTQQGCVEAEGRFADDYRENGTSV